MLFIFFVSTLLFFIGFIGIILFNNNLLNLLISVEVMIIGINIFLICSNINLDDLNGQIFILIILCIAACDAAIGLTLIIYYYKLSGSINIDIINLLNGN